MKRIKVVMADMETYRNNIYKDFTVHHVLLSNCHRNDNWYSIAIDSMAKENIQTLMIGVDV